MWLSDEHPKSLDCQLNIDLAPATLSGTLN
jgi:hypothetical protein